MIARDDLLAILELARWAPSGDNYQPWRFRLAGGNRIEITCTDQAGSDVYDFDGRPTLMTLGFLLETMAVAASGRGARIEWRYRQQGPHEHAIDVDVVEAGVPTDPLIAFIETRSVARGSYRRDPLGEGQKRELEDALGPDLQLAWFESDADKRTVVDINAMATHIRLSIPEAFVTHQRILDWERERSPDGVPSRAIGLDALTLMSMRWVMRKWSRAHFMNRYAKGTLMPQMQMDRIPGRNCAAHFMVFRRGEAGESGAEALIETGRRLQRFWLTASRLGLVMQPSLAPICFAYYARHQQPFTTDIAMREEARALDAALQKAAVRGDGELLFIGRIGTPLSRKEGPRSVRKPLSELLQA